ncbi:hypothetical protein GNF10_11215 [Nostoc sp. UCD121]|uniref:hypothetical protein n=1 Tax=unclassified Nostoc TaxID=2593658 RepID=UPI0016294F4C|nr:MULTISPECIES: hypothetical protein [unclassified Nostoc]MBC1218881.1 hypothetical protein [Nostoc sp. UCD120]MBC1276541.1 hypothetical protein [Nostoc sp. UCD121]MBC1297232.1 hypothetical protein [Nostoc sp. UCD122]
MPSNLVSSGEDTEGYGLPNKKLLKKLSSPHSSVSRQSLQRGEPPQRAGFCVSLWYPAASRSRSVS